MMLPPIHKSTIGLSSEGLGGGRKRVNGADSSVADRRGHQELSLAGNASTGAPSSLSPSSARLAERLYALERENEHFREELQHLRHLQSNNQQQREDEKIVEDLKRLAHSFNAKLQADMHLQQREQQKAALLFAEVARLGHGVEGLEGELRALADDTRRKLAAQDQHAQFLASLSSKQQQTASPERNTELERQVRDMQDAFVQLRSELDADRSARWKSEAAVDAKLDAQLDRLNTKLTADKREVARALDEQRQLLTGTDFQRVATHMREFSRVNDHLLTLERWLHGELSQVKRLFQAMAGDVDARFQCVLLELASGVKMWHAALIRQEDGLTLRLQDGEAATRAVALVVQRKLRALEEVVPLEVQARQKNDDKLRRRVEGAVKALGHAIEATREEFVQPQATLAQQVQQLTRDQETISTHVGSQQDAMQETMQAFMKDSDAMLATLAAAIEREHEKITQEVAAAVAMSKQAREKSEEETRRVETELRSLQGWTVTHAQECRAFCDFLNGSMDVSRRENAVRQCLDAAIDQIVDMEASRHMCALEASVEEAVRLAATAQAQAVSTSVPPPLAEPLSTPILERDQRQQDETSLSSTAATGRREAAASACNDDETRVENADDGEELEPTSGGLALDVAGDATLPDAMEGDPVRVDASPADAEPLDPRPSEEEANASEYEQEATWEEDGEGPVSDPENGEEVAPMASHEAVVEEQQPLPLAEAAGDRRELEPEEPLALDL
ncbi:hypothetical protein BBJ28_00009879 [Nothophytophthora sp. Chile5]|nr:hypothetical protein BBJ28_00009879 [Nothophytophthora sp. Chile5]